MKSACVLALLLLGVHPSDTPSTPDAGPKQEAGSCLLFGDHYSYGLQAPQGWIRDAVAGQGQGLDAVFYPKDSSWEAFDPVVYPQVWQKEGTLTLAEVMRRDLENFTQHSPGLTFVDKPLLRTKYGASAQIRHFQGARTGAYEAAAYIDERQVVVIILYSAKSKESFEKNYPAYSAILESFRFLGEFEKMPDEPQTGKPPQ